MSNSNELPLYDHGKSEGGQVNKKLLLNSADITELLQGYANTLENQESLLDDAKTSVKDKKYHDAYGYAVIVASMDSIEGDEENKYNANHRVGYYLQQLLKQNSNKEKFDEAIQYFETALTMGSGKGKEHEFQKTSNMMIATIKDYIKANKELSDGARINNITKAAGIGYDAINQSPTDSQVRMICSNLAYLIFAEFQKSHDEGLLERAGFFVLYSLKGTVKNKKNENIINGRENLREKINDSFSQENVCNDKEVVYDNILSKCDDIRGLLDIDYEEQKIEEPHLKTSEYHQK